MPVRPPVLQAVPLTIPLAVGPPELPVPWLKQIGTNMCWAACAQMVLQSRGDMVTQQCHLANMMFGGGCCADPFPCDFPCPSTGVEDLYVLLGLGVFRAFGVAEHFVLVDEITAGRPVELAMDVGTANGHLMLVIWAGLEDGEQWVRINDPQHGRVSVAFDELVPRGAFDSWVGIG